jgi:hypothetical protein
MGDHRFNGLKDALGRELDIPGDPLRDKLCTLNRHADPLSLVDQEDLYSLLGRSLRSA